MLLIDSLISKSLTVSQKLYCLLFSMPFLTFYSAAVKIIETCHFDLRSPWPFHHISRDLVSVWGDVGHLGSETVGTDGLSGAPHICGVGTG